MRTRLFLSGLLIAFSVSAASAADRFGYMTNPNPVADWSGMWAGIFGGGVWGDTSSSTFAPGASVDGGLFGVDIGYDRYLDNGWVFGAFVSIPLINASGSSTFGGGVKAEAQWAIAPSLRIGFPVGRFLPYAFVGAVFGEGKATHSTGPTDTQTHFGWQIGAGVDYAIDDRWRVGLRYAYFDMGSETYSLFPPATASVGFDGSSFAATLSYRFRPY